MAEAQKRPDELRRRASPHRRCHHRRSSAVAAESTVADAHERAPVLRRGGLPGAARPRGGVAVHPAGAAARPARRHRRRRPATASRSTSSAPEGVTVETVGRDDARLGKAGKPVDRVAAQAYSVLREGRRRHRPQGGGARPSRSGSPCTARAAPPTATRSSSSAPSPRPSSSSTTPVTPCSPPTSSTSSATAPSSPSSPSRTGTTSAVHVAQHNALVGRDATFKSVVVTFGGDLVRLHPRVVYARPRRRGRAVRPVLHRRRPAPGAPPLRRPRRPALPVATSPTRARCRARTRTRCGSATC